MPKLIDLFNKQLCYLLGVCSLIAQYSYKGLTKAVYKYQNTVVPVLVNWELLKVYCKVLYRVVGY